jgi:hypothetical protein
VQVEDEQREFDEAVADLVDRGSDVRFLEKAISVWKPGRRTVLIEEPYQSIAFKVNKRHLPRVVAEAFLGDRG